MVGQRFGKLVVVSRAPSGSRQSKWFCRCDCGKTSTPFGFSLRTGKTRSCGCVAAEKARLRWANPTPGMRAVASASARTHGMSRHPAFSSWAAMKDRCFNPAARWYPSYGGRGITVCIRWRDSFAAFWEDMGPSWFPGGTLGRVDNDGPYAPGNVRWETPKTQQRNKRNTVVVNTPLGAMRLMDAADLTGISRDCLAYRAKAGWPPEKMFQPSQRESK